MLFSRLLWLTVFTVLWSKALGQVSCSDLTEPGNGMISYDMGTVGDRPENTVATYSCVTGFVVSGNSTRTCMSDGTWNGSDPTCIVISCGVPGSIPNGSPSSNNELTFGQTVTYTCDNDFQISPGVNSAVATCELDGILSNIPTCVDIFCADLPQPTNGMIFFNDGSTNNRSVGTTATLSCSPGYGQSSGDTSRQCMSDGQWNGSQLVCVRDCGAPPTITDGSITTNPPSTLLGNSATYTCNPGFDISTGQTTAEALCIASGIWFQVPTCRAIVCANLPTISNGVITYDQDSVNNDRPLGTIATLSCDSGYGRILGDTSRQCMNNSDWSGSQLICIRDCGTPPNISDGSITSNPPNTLQGSTVTYTCDSGFDVSTGVTTATASCGTDGSWNGVPTCSIVDEVTTMPPTAPSTTLPALICVDLPQPPNGAVNYNGAGSTNNRPVGTFATVSCSPGYGRSQGDASRVCQSNGQWSGSQLVCVRDCGSPPAVSNGNHTSPSNTLQDSRVTYNFEATCQADGSWSNVPNSLASSDSTAAVIGGVVAIAIVTVAITVIIVVVLILRHKKSGKMPVSTDVQLSPVAPPTYDVMPGEYEEIPANKTTPTESKTQYDYTVNEAYATTAQ